MVCGEPCFEDPHLDTLLNPDLIFEILSESTETYDRGRKYVAQSECRIEQFVRQTGGQWLYTESADPNGSIEVASIACLLPLSRVYHRIEFQAAASS